MRLIIFIILLHAPTSLAKLSEPDKRGLYIGCMYDARTLKKPNLALKTYCICLVQQLDLWTVDKPLKTLTKEARINKLLDLYIACSAHMRKRG